MVARQRDIGAFLVTKNALTPVTLNSNSTAENGTEQTGITIDRANTTPGTQLNLSGKVSIPMSYSLAATQQVAIVSNAQHSVASSAGWGDLADKDGSTVASKTLGTTGSTAAQTGNTVLEYDLDLGKAKQFVRIQLTATFDESATASGSDDVDVAGILIMGGSDVTPAA